MKRIVMVWAGLFGVMACGDSVGLAAELMHDAGEMLQDAAQALDSGTDAAQAQEQPSDSGSMLPTAIEAACSLTRLVPPSASSPASFEGDQHWAAVEVERDAVRQVWTCESTKPSNGCPGTCDGDEIPAPECEQTLGQYQGGKLWIFCGQGATHWQTVHVIVN